MPLPERLKKILPDLPALVTVLVCGAVGAWLACWWDLRIGEKDFASDIAKLDWVLRILLGSFGAAAAVFVLAKTDTSKLIHCGIIAALSGMAGPYLVIKALSTVASVNANLVQTGSGIGVLQSTTATLDDTIQAPATDTNPQKVVDVFDQTAQATASYLTAVTAAPETERQRLLADSKSQLETTLKVLGAAASIVPKQSIPLIKKVATAAKEAGAPAVAEEAQKILDTNSAVRTAVQTSENIGKVYFITPEDLTDNLLHDLEDRIRRRFPLADIQPAVHPSKRVGSGLEFVYYRDTPSDKQIANELSKVVVEYLKDYKVVPKTLSVRKYSTSQATPTPPFQFDIHIGPDIAASLIGLSKSNP